MKLIINYLQLPLVTLKNGSFYFSLTPASSVSSPRRRRRDGQEIRRIGPWLQLQSRATSATLGVAYFLHTHSFAFFLVAQVASGVIQFVGWPCIIAVVGNWFGHTSSRGTIMGGGGHSWFLHS
jgi:hypothetical protein